jgi:hypothetical protein
MVFDISLRANAAVRRRRSVIVDLVRRHIENWNHLTLLVSAMSFFSVIPIPVLVLVRLMAQHCMINAIPVADVGCCWDFCNGRRGCKWGCSFDVLDQTLSANFFSFLLPITSSRNTLRRQLLEGRLNFPASQNGRYQDCRNQTFHRSEARHVSLSASCPS